MNNSAKAAKMAAQWERKWGSKAGSTGDAKYELDVIPTGSSALDYALGTGGWACGHPIEIMGKPDIGKTSSLGYSAIANAQAMGKYCVLIALEPGFDPAWAELNGVDTKSLLIGRPDNGQEAFNMLADAVSSGAGFVLFDSIGAVLRESEAEIDGKPAQGGRSSLISWGVSNVLMKVWKQGVGLIFLNQVRDDMKSRISGLVESPGGWALKHSAAVRIEVKLGAKAYMQKVEGEEMEVGRNVVCVIKRNKLSQGSRRRADFDYYIKATQDHPVGIDKTKDLINIAMTTGVIKQGGAFYSYSNFPADAKGDNKIKSRDAVEEYIYSNPAIVDQIREDLLEVMVERQGEVIEVLPTFEDEDGPEGE